MKLNSCVCCFMAATNIFEMSSGGDQIEKPLLRRIRMQIGPLVLPPAWLGMYGTKASRRLPGLPHILLRTLRRRPPLHSSVTPWLSPLSQGLIKLRCFFACGVSPFGLAKKASAQSHAVRSFVRIMPGRLLR